MTNTWLDLVRERKKRNMKVTVMLLVVVALGTVSTGLEKKRLKELEIREKIETTEIIALVRSTRILRRVLET